MIYLETDLLIIFRYSSIKGLENLEFFQRFAIFAMTSYRRIE